MVDKLKEKGFRDARIISDSIIINNDKTISINIDIEEGKNTPMVKLTFWAIQYILMNNSIKC